MARIQNVHGREVLDSRGNPTIEVEITLDNGIKALSSVPSGASTGTKEALELRDEDSSRYGGKGVRKAVENVNLTITEAIKGKEPYNQKEIDDLLVELDGTEEKSKLGANAILGTSMAVAKSAAADKGIALFEHLGNKDDFRLPVPFFNILNGGAHADTNVDIQEFMIAPIGAPNFSEALRFGSQTYHSLKNVLKAEKLNTGVVDEGGFAPELSSNRDALELIIVAIEKAGYKPGKDIALAMDAAASEFYKDGQYVLKADKKQLDSKGMIDFYRVLMDQYPIISIEDPLSEHDWDGWKQITAELGKNVQLVGDDLFVTNSKILAKGIELQVANAVLIKLNQIGTVTQTLDTIQLATGNSYNCMFSHRSGETEDTFLADIAVATGVGQIKSGAPARSERVAKYNQLLRIEEKLGKDAQYYRFGK